MNNVVGIRVSTDGCCLRNPGGAGGWACRIYLPSSCLEISDGEASTTNNRMEMMAVIQALEQLPEGSVLQLSTDSQYVRDGITRWIKGWKRNGWRTAANEPVKNQDLWQRMDQAAGKHVISWKWVRGHGTDADNIWCDEAARQAALRFVPKEDEAPKPKLPHRSILLAALRALVAVEPLSEGYLCLYCSENVLDTEVHLPNCAWRRARELTESQPDDLSGISEAGAAPEPICGTAAAEVAAGNGSDHRS